jgi:hypothetical protein
MRFPRDTTMPTTETWFLAVVRTLQSARWGLCLAGVALSVFVGALALALFDGTALRLAAWRQQPLEQVSHLGRLVFGHGSGRAVVRGALLAVALAAVWGPLAGWIARAELLCHRAAGGQDPADAPAQVTPTRFVRMRRVSLLALVPAIVCFTVSMLVMGLIAGLINSFLCGLGAILVALLLPLLLLGSLLVVLVVVGSPSWTIMPAALAAEGADNFDALARGYSYFFQRPLAFAGWTGLALAVASLPLVGLSYLMDLAVDPAASWRGPALLAAAALSSSLFWTLQSLVYLKLRRLVDETPESEIWDDAPGAAAAPDERARAASPPAEEASPPPARPEPRSYTLRDTVTAGRSASLPRLLVLLAAVLATALVLGGGLLVVRQLDGAAALSLASLREAVLRQAGQSPGLLAGIAAAILVLGAVVLGGPLKLVARMAAVQAVHQQELPLRAALAFPRRTRGRQLASAVLAAGGVELYVLAGLLVPLAWDGTCGWEEVFTLGGAAAVGLGVGALGLGALAVEDPPRQEPAPGVLSTSLSNGSATLASAVANLGTGLLWWAAGAGCAWLTWWTACESLSWWGGPHVQWPRWGLDGGVVPVVDGGLHRLASWIAGFWFLLLCGLVLVYPISCALRWGAVCYLLARQRTADIPPEQLTLSAEEQAALAVRKMKRKDTKELLQKLARRVEKPPPAPLEKPPSAPNL